MKHECTSIVYEYPRADGDPYYPVPKADNDDLYRRYKELADATSGVHFVGRLATYRYYNMDQVVAQALAVYAHIKEQGHKPGVLRNAYPGKHGHEMEIAHGSQ